MPATNNLNILLHRQHNQQLLGTNFKKPQQVVHWLGAMQAQEYAMARWAIGLRLHGQASDAIVENAFNDGKILRTHMLRPTWHFVAPEDIRWIQQLTAHRVHTVIGSMYRKCGLDTKTLNRATNIISRSLEGKKYLTRIELQTVLQQNKIKAEGFRLGYIMMYAELEAIVCSGPRKGKQFTYALLDERAAPVKHIKKDEALLQLTTCYFSSRGPANIQDYTWWSGLTIKEAKEGINMLPGAFECTTINGREYFFREQELNNKTQLATFLMPDYDEYGIAYKHREALSYKPKPGTKYHPGPQSPYSHWLVIDGVIAGTWQLTTKGHITTATAYPFVPVTKVQQSAVDKAVKQFHSFVNADTRTISKLIA